MPESVLLTAWAIVWSLTAPAHELPDADTVVVLRGGHAFMVRSYEIQGPLVRIVDQAGNLLTVRVSELDREGSQAATAEHRAELARRAEAERATAEARRQEALRREQARSSHHALFRSRGGTMNLAPPARETAAAGGPAAGEPSEEDAEGSAKEGTQAEPEADPTTRQQHELAALARERQQLLEERDRLAEGLQAPEGRNREEMANQLAKLSGRLEALDKQIAALEAGLSRGAAGR